MKRPFSVVLAALVLLAVGCDRATENAPAPVSVQDLPKLTGKVTFQLEDGEDYHRQAPSTFEIPDQVRRENLKDGEIVKLMFRFIGDNDSRVERMWVIVKGRDEDGYRGVLDNQPYCTDQVKAGIEVRFKPRHVINIWIDEAHPEVMKAKTNDEREAAQPGATDNPVSAPRNLR